MKRKIAKQNAEEKKWKEELEKMKKEKGIDYTIPSLFINSNTYSLISSPFH